MSRKTEKKRRMSAGRVLDTGMTYLILLAVAFVFFFPCRLCMREAIAA